MAVYFLRSKHVSRGKGSRATRAAAYRSGERIRDERTSEVYDYSDRCDVAHKEIVLPADLAERPDMAWARDRATLWNAAEHAGLRCNSRLAREWLAILPIELTPERRIELARSFAKELAEKYRCAVDVCVHLPRPGADSRNHHVHLLMTHREITPDGMGRRTELELGNRERLQMGLERSSRDEYIALRGRWAELTNEAYQRAGLSVRVDHRSLHKQGINREPAPNIPEKVFYAEQRSGQESAAGNAIRARHRERVEARQLGEGELSRVVQRQKAALKERMLADSMLQKDGARKVRWGALTREERNEKRRERYQARRALEKQDLKGEEKRRETKRAQYYARMQKDPEAVREAQRRWREANREKVNRKQREYRKEHAAELALKRREYHRSLESPAQTPEESVKRWLKYRERHGPGPTADDAVRNYLAYREREKDAEQSKNGPSRELEREKRGRSIADEEHELKKQRSHDYDLEM